MTYYDRDLQDTLARLNDTCAELRGCSRFERNLRRLSGCNYNERASDREWRITLAVLDYQAQERWSW